MSDYSTIDSPFVAELRELLREEVRIDSDILDKYSKDETAELDAHRPEVVVFVRNASEVAAVMKLANAKRIPVTPRGAGTGLSGGAIPVYGGIVLSLEKMNEIVEFDEKNMMITVQPGVITGDIQKLADSHGLVYAGDPCSSESSTIGGNVAENAGGNKVLKYGPTGSHVLSLEFVTAKGEIIRLGGKRLKDVTGFDLTHLLVGSEGTLGIITEITIRLIPKQKYSVALLVPFDLFDDAVAAVPRLMTECGVLPSSLEFMDHASISTVCKFLNTDFPFQEAGAHLIIEVEGNSKDAIFEEYVSIGEKALELGGQEVFVADNRNSREKLWKVRKSIAEALAGIRPVHCMEDVSVPTSSIPELISASNAIARDQHLDILSFGHAGDGNVHITFMNPDHPRSEWKNRLGRCLDKLYEITISLGGCITGEHGVGLKRKEAFMRTTDPALLSIVASLKSVFDPNKILNPGKIID